MLSFISDALSRKERTSRTDIDIFELDLSPIQDRSRIKMYEDISNVYKAEIIGEKLFIKVSWHYLNFTLYYWNWIDAVRWGPKVKLPWWVNDIVSRTTSWMVVSNWCELRGGWGHVHTWCRLLEPPTNIPATEPPHSLPMPPPSCMGWGKAESFFLRSLGMSYWKFIGSLE